METHANVSPDIMHLFALGKKVLKHTNKKNLCTMCWEVLDFIG